MCYLVVKLFLKFESSVFGVSNYKMKIEIQ